MQIENCKRVQTDLIALKTHKFPTMCTPHTQNTNSKRKNDQNWLIVRIVCGERNLWTTNIIFNYYYYIFVKRDEKCSSKTMASVVSTIFILSFKSDMVKTLSENLLISEWNF